MSQPPNRVEEFGGGRLPGSICPDDTILAVSTPAGASRRAIVRMSGSDSLRVAAQVFRSDDDLSLENRESYEVVAGRLSLEGFPANIRALLYVMRAPGSYTREDVVELHVPGSQPLVEGLLEILLNGSMRLASPGEFTRRAFLAGRLDLTQVEAVLKLVNAASEEEMRGALMELEGRFSHELAKVRDGLFELLIQIEAALDFSEQGIELIEAKHAQEAIHDVETVLSSLEGTAGRDYVYRDRPRVLLAGKPNAGKSSLFNRLIGAQEAIVSDIPGTTRDVLEVDFSLHGEDITLVDVAGTGQVEDALAGTAQAKAGREREKADLVVLVIDATAPAGDVPLPDAGGQVCLVAVNKVDLATEVPGGRNAPPGVLGVYHVSARTGEGCNELARRLADVVTYGKLQRSGRGFVLNLRQREGLKRAIAATSRAIKTIENDAGYEFTALELKEAINALSGLMGSKDFDAVLDGVFAQFCVGK